MWFQGDTLLVGGDLVPLLNPVPHLSNLIYVWNEANLGALKVTVPRLFSPFYISQAFGQLTGLGYPTGEKILVVSIYSLAAISIYFLWPLLFQQARWQTSAVVASLAYVYSPYLIADGTQTSIRFAAQYALVPFFLLLFVRGVTRSDIRYAALIGLLSPLVFSDFPGYQVAGYVAISCLFFSAFHMISTRKIRFNALFAGLSAILSLLINMWWMLPIFSNIGGYTSALTVGPGDFATQSYSTIAQLFRFLGKWSFYSSFNGVSYLPYSTTYDANALSVGLSFGPIALAFAALLVRPRHRSVLFCAWAAIIGFFLTKGINPPLGFLYQSLVSIFPPFRVYRESFYLLQLAVIPTSLMIGATIGKFFDSAQSQAYPKKTRRHKNALNRLGRYLIPFAMIVVILGASWPLLSNDISINGLGGQTRGVKIPDSYSKLIDWLGRNPDNLNSKVLVLPQRGDYAAYTWGYVGGNLLYDALPNVVLGGDTVYLPTPDTQWAANLVYESFYKNSTSFPTLLNIIGVKYIVLENTFNTTFYGLPPITVDRALLAHRSSLVLERDFGEVTLYRNLNFTSELYVPNTLLPFDSSIRQPGGIVWQDTNLASNWTIEKWNNESTSLESEGGILHEGLLASGGYVSGSIVKTVSPPVDGARHLLVHYRTNAFTSFTVEILGENGSYYPSSVNSPTNGLGKSVDWYAQAFDLSAREGSPQGIRIWITNYNDRGYSGRLDLWIDSISLVRYIGSTNDTLTFLEEATAKSPVSFYSPAQVSPNTNGIMNNSTVGHATILSVERQDPTSYSVILQLNGSAILVFSQAFSQGWTARIGGLVVQDHFRINRFANGWLLSGYGRTTLNLEFSTQTLVWYGLGISISSAVSTLIILIVVRRRRNSPARVSPRPPETLIP